MIVMDVLGKRRKERGEYTASRTETDGKDERNQAVSEGHRPPNKRGKGAEEEDGMDIVTSKRC